VSQTNKHGGTAGLMRGFSRRAQFDAATEEQATTAPFTPRSAATEASLRARFEAVGQTPSPAEAVSGEAGELSIDVGRSKSPSALGALYRQKSASGERRFSIKFGLDAFMVGERSGSVSQTNKHGGLAGLMRGFSRRAQFDAATDEQATTAPFTPRSAATEASLASVRIMWDERMGSARLCVVSPVRPVGSPRSRWKPRFPKPAVASAPTLVGSSDGDKEGALPGPESAVAPRSQSGMQEQRPLAPSGHKTLDLPAPSDAPPALSPQSGMQEQSTRGHLVPFTHTTLGLHAPNDTPLGYTPRGDVAWDQLEDRKCVAESMAWI